MKMKLTVLAENTARSGEYIAEHGLSFYIETEKHNILFDTGQTDAFIKNAEILGIDLNNADIAILSHGHYDHGGGLKAFLKLNNHAKVYINRHAFDDYYSVDGRYLGLNKALAASDRIIFTDDETTIDDDLYLFTGNNLKREHYMDTFGLLSRRGGETLPDDFRHEQYLIISESGKRVLISGCSHKGILNIMDWVKEYDVSSVFGGFHYMKLDAGRDRGFLRNAARELLKYGAKFYTCHCTGTAQGACMREIMKDRLEYISAGSVINI